MNTLYIEDGMDMRLVSFSVVSTLDIKKEREKVYKLKGHAYLGFIQKWDSEGPIVLDVTFTSQPN